MCLCVCVCERERRVCICILCCHILNTRQEIGTNHPHAHSPHTAALARKHSLSNSLSGTLRLLRERGREGEELCAF